jgi:hypothetical protein
MSEVRKLFPDCKHTIHKFTVLHEGWEMDNKGWVIECEDGARHLVLTSHGRPRKAEARELADKLVEYRKAISETQEALDLLGLGVA